MSRSLCALALALALTCALAPVVVADPAAAGIWTEIPSGTSQNITAIEYQSPTRFWFTTAAGAIHTRQPNGSFTTTRAPSGIPLNDIEFQDGGPIGLAVGNGGQVQRSTNNGATWTAITGIQVSTPRCRATSTLGDVNAVRFAGNGRAWIFAAGSQIATSQPSSPGQVGATWRDANPVAGGGCKVPSEHGYADAFFVPTNPDVGYIVSSESSLVFFTSDNLATAAWRRPVVAGYYYGSPSRVLAGDPMNPGRMWSTDARDAGYRELGATRDGWHTDADWSIGNVRARLFPPQGPADIDFAGGTVLAAGTDGLILNSADGETFYYSSADGTLASQRWNAVSLANTTLGAIGGDNGRLALTTQANVAPPAPPPPPPPPPDPPNHPTPKATPAPTPVTVPVPRAGRDWTTGTVSGRVLVNGRSLTSKRRLPLGTIVDARDGTLTINVAVNARTGATDSATVSKGIFQVSQRRRGTTASSSIRLQTPRGKHRACAARKGPPKGIVRTLKGAVTGSFTIVGKAATATARNASWVVEDGCSGTRIKNVRGMVSAKSARTGRMVSVRPRRTFLAKARLFAAKPH